MFGAPKPSEVKPVETVPCDECGNIVKKSMAQVVFDSNRSDLHYCYAHKKGYARVVWHYDFTQSDAIIKGKPHYFKEVEVDESGKLIK